MKDGLLNSLEATMEEDLTMDQSICIASFRVAVNQFVPPIALLIIGSAAAVVAVIAVNDNFTIQKLDVPLVCMITTAIRTIIGTAVPMI